MDAYLSDFSHTCTRVLGKNIRSKKANFANRRLAKRFELSGMKVQLGNATQQTLHDVRVLIMERGQSESKQNEKLKWTKLRLAKSTLKLGPLENQADFEELDAPTVGATNNALMGNFLPPNVRFTACPNT